MLTFLLWKVVQNMKICLRYPSPKSPSSGRGITIAISWLKVTQL